MSNKKQIPLKFLSKLLTDKIDKYKELKTDIPIQELVRLKTDVLLLIQDEKEIIETAHRAGQRNAGIDPSSHSALNYYLETFKND